MLIHKERYYQKLQGTKFRWWHKNVGQRTASLRQKTKLIYIQINSVLFSLIYHPHHANFKRFHGDKTPTNKTRWHRFQLSYSICFRTRN